MVLVHDAFNVNALIALNVRFFFFTILLNDGLLNSVRFSMLLAIMVICNKQSGRNQNIIKLNTKLALLLIRIRTSPFLFCL